MPGREREPQRCHLNPTDVVLPDAPSYCQENLQTCSTMNDPGNTRLGEAVRQRRLDLGLTQSQVDNVSLSTIAKIESGGFPRLRDGTLVALEKALGWEPGSARRVLAGGDPTPASETPPPSRIEQQLAELTELVRQLAEHLLPKDAR